jgi:hypothetical protein
MKRESERQLALMVSLMNFVKIKLENNNKRIASYFEIPLWLREARGDAVG